MDPNSGRLYESLNAARLDGVEEPVEIVATPEQAQRISEAVARVYSSEQRAKKRAKNKAARGARKVGR